MSPAGQPWEPVDVEPPGLPCAPRSSVRASSLNSTMSWRAGVCCKERGSPPERWAEVAVQRAQSREQGWRGAWCPVVRLARGICHSAPAVALASSIALPGPVLPHPWQAGGPWPSPGPAAQSLLCPCCPQRAASGSRSEKKQGLFVGQLQLGWSEVPRAGPGTGTNIAAGAWGSAHAAGVPLGPSICST